MRTPERLKGFGEPLAAAKKQFVILLGATCVHTSEERNMVKLLLSSRLVPHCGFDSE